MKSRLVFRTAFAACLGLLSAVSFAATGPVFGADRRHHPIADVELADATDPNVLYELGVLFLRGEGVSADPSLGRRYLERAVAQGHKWARIRLGIALIIGDVLPADKAAGLALLTPIAKADDADADVLFQLGNLLLTGGGGVEADPQRARGYLERAVELGHKWARIRLGVALIKGDRPADKVAGVALLTPLAEADDADADVLFHLGNLLLAGGDGVTADPQQARGYLERAVELGNKWARIRLGIALIKGVELPADGAAGVALLTPLAGAEDANDDVLFQLGNLLLTGGSGVAADPQRARGYLERAVELGNKWARIRLGTVLLRGDVLPVDPVKGNGLLQDKGGN